MPANNKVAISLFLALIVTTLIAAPHGILSSPSSALSGQKQTNESQIPVTDYSAPESKNSEERAKRKEKSRRHSKAGPKIKEEPEIMVVTDSESQFRRLTPLPIPISDVVIIGDVKSAEAYLTEDKSGVYSEFSIRIDQILKSNAESLYPGSLIVAGREGGGVKFPSGHVQYYEVDSERMPGVWRRYVFFLKRNDPEQDFRLLKAYELRAGQVFPLDDFTRDAVYKGMDQDVFISVVKKEITESSEMKSGKARQDQ